MPIDKVRVITNIFSGRTGALIATQAQKHGAKVKLLLGPGRFNPPKNVKTTRFYYFDQLYALMQKELKKNKYDVVIHSAAISDYQPVIKNLKKVPSGKKNLKIRLKPTPKIIKMIKKLNPKTFLVQFKLEVGKSPKQLVNIGYKSMRSNRADLVVVNDLKKMTHNKQEAYFVNSDKNIIKVNKRGDLVKKLLKTIEQKL